MLTPQQILDGFAQCRIDVENDHFYACLEAFMYDLMSTISPIIETSELIEKKANRRTLAAEVEDTLKEYFMNHYL